MLSFLDYIILNFFAFVNPFFTEILNFFVKFLLTSSKQICYNDKNAY